MNTQKLAPIILLAYRRLELLKKTVGSLLANDLAKDSELYVFCDAPANPSVAAEVEAVRKFVSEITGFKEKKVFLSTVNLGLAESVKNAVNRVFETHDRLIVIEDDIQCSIDFLSYINRGLELYEHNPLLFSITGHRYPFSIPENYREQTFLMPRSCAWGWATWKDRWQKVDWDTDYFDLLERNNYLRKRFIERNGYDWIQVAKMRKRGVMDVWSDFWNYAHFQHDAFSLAPIKMKTNHIGYDKFAVNEKRGSQEQVNAILDHEPLNFEPFPAPDEQILKNISYYFSGTSLYNFKREIRIRTGIDIA